MTEPRKKILYWTPRVLGLLFALFVSLFALDVFGVGYSFWESILALLIHLVPVYILLIALAVAWRWEWAGALIYVALTIWYLVMTWEPYPIGINLAATWPIALPPLVIALLFLIDWLYGSKKRVTV